ncbi:hypothetical protein TNCV_3641861 [Trichonephila clavipes]|nr:hypothetical protein TNCV_3641861 [Trichonephila clavipes]
MGCILTTKPFADMANPQEWKPFHRWHHLVAASATKTCRLTLIQFKLSSDANIVESNRAHGNFYIPLNHTTCVPTTFASRKSINSSRD